VKFRFDDQPHQATAIASVVDLFEGAISVQESLNQRAYPKFAINLDQLVENLELVTDREGVGKQTTISALETDDLRGNPRTFPNFSVEMETGTGKTYVYISTALRLAEVHHIRKFVILVHSVAIRAGVVKTFEQTLEHFTAKYPSIKYNVGVLGEGPALTDFLEPSTTVQFLIISVQAIDKPDSNAVYQTPEQPSLWSESTTGMAGISALRPVVIIDEPQNMATETRRRALATLNPLVALRYSATHRELFNLVHRLGPKAASDAGLVKRVSVKGILAGKSGVPYLHFQRIRTAKGRMIADVVVDQARADGTSRTGLVVQNGSDLFEESGGLDAYRGMIVDHFERKPDRIFFDNGAELRVGETVGADALSTWRDQIRHTIRQHLARQAQLDAAGYKVKVLSLFFVEHVADYFPLGPDVVPPLPVIFDELFEEEWVRAGLPADSCPDPSTLRVHYFPSTKGGIYRDTRGIAADVELEARAYEEIIANKELLLARENPRAFIFSHSALREGWDNPNVFQVGFLRHSHSDMERRQQIGRGLRLPVDESGQRIFDPAVCRLTLVVDESFAEFRDGLNREYVAAGESIDSTPPTDDVDSQIVVRRRPEKFESPEFRELWSHVRYRARYRVTLDPAAIPAAVARSERLAEVAEIARRSNVVQSGELVYDDSGPVITSDWTIAESVGENLSIIGQQLPDLVRLVEDQLLSGKFPIQLSRPTLRAILTDLPPNVKRRAIDDPEKWSRLVGDTIRVVVVEQMASNIEYEPTAESDWWNAEAIFLDTEPYDSSNVDQDASRGVAAGRAGGSNLFDHTIYDSKVEKSFAEQLENDENVRLYTKLPRRYRISTPVGEYSPDWAVVYQQAGAVRLFLVRETKDTTILADLKWDEAMRIRFAAWHYLAAPTGPIDFLHTSAAEGLRPPV
jgi:type III restriction enzyme